MNRNDFQTQIEKVNEMIKKERALLKQDPDRAKDGLLLAEPRKEARNRALER